MEQAKLKNVGRFELTQSLGREGEVSVYLAHDPHLDRDIVIRVADLAHFDESRQESFFQRARKLSDLRHSRFATVLDFGQTEGLIFLATNRVQGDSLTKVARTNRGIEPRQVALLVGKLALAVHQVHEAGLTHGFLNPDCMLLENGGDPVITDLGMAPELRFTSNHEADAFHDDFVAPEVSVSQGEDIQTQSDVFSLGAIGYFVLTGRTPKSADDVEDAAFLDDMEESAASDFKAAFTKALAVGASDRFGTARELAGAMDRLYRNTPKINPTVADTKPTEGATSPSDFEQFDLQLIEDSHVVHLHDASVLSTEALVQTKRELFEAVEKLNPKRLIINFASVRFCSSETVGILIQLNKELKPSDTLLYLCGMRDSIREVFRVLNLDGTVFEIRGTVSNALKSVE